MDQITVIGRRGVTHDLLVSLQSLGVVQIDPLEPDETLPLDRMQLRPADRDQRDGWDAAVARSAALIDALGAQATVPAGRGEVPTELGEITKYLEAVGGQVDQLVAERSRIRDELEVIDTYLPAFRELAPFLGQLEGCRFLFGTAFSVPADEFESAQSLLLEALEERILFTARDRGTEFLVVAAVLKRDRELLRSALGKAGYIELSLPEGYSDFGVAKAVHVMTERSQALPKRLGIVAGELAKLAGRHGARLRTLHQLALNHQARFERLQDMLQGHYGFALRGWLPSASRARAVERLKKQFNGDVIIETWAADEHHDRDVPVMLENPGWVKPFEGLLALFAPPKYGSFDPSWTLAVFFPFFFGMVVGDIGFGLLFAAIAWWMRLRGARGKELGLGPLGITISSGALRPISTVIFWCSAWSVLFGFLFGEFFGNLLERFPASRPFFYSTLHEPPGHGLINILILRVEIFTPLLLLSVGFGVLQVLGGWLIRVIYGVRHNDSKHVYEGIGMFSGLLAIVIFATAFLTQNLNPVVNGIVIVGFAVFVVCAALARMPLMLVEIISNSGNILSYLRLFAVGLAAALVANLSTDLGYAVGGTLPVIGPLLGIVVGLAVHFIAIALTIIGHTLQPLRLQYVEFFTKFGFYDESGRAYRPFRLLGGKA